MSVQDLDEPVHGAAPHARKFTAGPAQAPSPEETDFAASIEQTLKLGDQFISFTSAIMDLARTEISLAARTLPSLVMLWLLMMPILLITWGAFSVLTAWGVYALTQEVGWGLLVLFLQQLLLLCACRGLYLHYRKRMTLPHTRAHINEFVRGMHYGPGERSEKKE